MNRYVTGRVTAVGRRVKLCEQCGSGGPRCGTALMTAVGHDAAVLEENRCCVLVQAGLERGINTTLYTS